MKKTNLLTGLFMAAMLLFSAISHAQYSGGSGTSGDPYQIATKDDLIELSNTSGDWGDYFIQTDDIAFDATEANVDWNGDGSAGPAEGFSPIGNWTTKFTGAYNGDGHTISNLYIDRSSTSQIGLFGYTNGATIQNIGLIDVDIKGVNGVGGLVGYNYNNSTVENSYSTGSVYGERTVGGLVGLNVLFSTVSKSFSHCDVTRASGSFGITNFGGFCGYNNKATIEYCYSTGDVIYDGDANPTDKGFVGYDDSGNYTANFFDSDASNQSSDAVGAATAKTTPEMQLIETYTDETTVGLTSAWDFVGTENDDSGTNDYWGINYNGQNNGYPFLSWQNYDHVVSQPGLWIGAEDADWHNSNNWDDGQVPGASVDVTIPETGNDPVISSAATCQNITIQANSTLTINSNQTLAVTGNFTLEANGDFTNNGTLLFSGSDCHLSDNRATKSSLGNIIVYETAL